MSEFTVGYERKLSDGNYGSEGLSISWTWTKDGDDPPGEWIEDAIKVLRVTVLKQLARSGAERVAWGARRELEPPKPIATPAAPDSEESLEDLPF